MGVAVGDYDNDGYPDLMALGYGRSILYLAALPGLQWVGRLDGARRQAGDSLSFTDVMPPDVAAIFTRTLRPFRLGGAKYLRK